MSDHYTRVTTGGSPLPKEAPVVGLLFGHTHSGGAENAPAIVDAEDVPLDAPTPAVNLHKAVFPQNVVMGCYRVTPTESQPTAADIRQVQSLQKALLSAAAVSSETSPNASNDETEKKLMNEQLYFGLLQVNPRVKDVTTSSQSDEESELPLQLFILQDSVLVAVEDWHLTTAASAERIAVERVLRDKPKSEHNDDAKVAWQALDARLQQLEEFLQLSATVSPPDPQHLELWRAIQGLLVQANLLRSTGGRETNLLPQQVAVLAKTVDAIAWYTDKFRVVYEAKGAAVASLRERRF